MSYARRLATLALIFGLVTAVAAVFKGTFVYGGWGLPQGTQFWRVANGALVGLIFTGTVNAISIVIRFARGKGGLAVLIGLAAFFLSPILCAVGTVTVLPYMVHCLFRIFQKPRPRVRQPVGRTDSGGESSMKVSTYFGLRMSVVGVCIPVIYLTYVLQSNNLFVNGFLTCLVIVLLLLVFQWFRTLSKTFMTAVTLDPEYIHFHSISRKVLHIRVEEVKRIEIRMRNGAKCDKQSKYADIIAFELVYGASISAVRYYKRNGKRRGLYATDREGNRLSLDFEAVRALVTKENFPDAVIVSNEIAPPQP